jgi:hypothetical protein
MDSLDNLAVYMPDSQMRLVVLFDFCRFVLFIIVAACKESCYYMR